MSHLGLLALFIIHAFHRLKRFLSWLVPAPTPKPLLARRRRIPTHLAVILVPDAENYDARVEETVMEECVEQVVDWCKELGMQRLSIYERDGVLSRKSRYASPGFSQEPIDLSDNTALKPPRGPPTPPASDTDSTSRPRSPEFELGASRFSVATFQIPYLTRDDASEAEKKSHRRHRKSQIFESKPRRQTLTLHFLSRESSKPAVAAAARTLALERAPSSRKNRGSFDLTIESLNGVLEGNTGFPSPDFIIVHSLYPSTAPLELHGFPPWQSRLSEIYYAPRRPRVLRYILRFLPRSKPMSTALALSEMGFRRALDEFSDAEMRLGK